MCRTLVVLLASLPVHLSAWTLPGLVREDLAAPIARESAGAPQVPDTVAARTEVDSSATVQEADPTAAPQEADSTEEAGQPDSLTAAARADSVLPEAGIPLSDTLTPEAPNPFAGFETHYLANGVKVWFKHLPGSPNVSVNAGVPVGSDADPPGKEQLAHFTEHMLFSDHEGKTEQEIKDAVEGLGGQRNGFTYRDHTWYYVYRCWFSGQEDALNIRLPCG